MRNSYQYQKSRYNIDIKIEQRPMKVKSDFAIKKINRLHEIQILYACVNICVVPRDWSEHDESLKIIRQFYPASYLPRRSVEKENSRLSRALSSSHAATLWCIPHGSLNSFHSRLVYFGSIFSTPLFRSGRFSRHKRGGCPIWHPYILIRMQSRVNPNAPRFSLPFLIPSGKRILCTTEDMVNVMP